MRIMTKKLLLIVTTALTVVCLFFGGVFAFSQTKSVKAADVETVDVQLSSIHGTWNNYAYDNAYCTFLQFTGGVGVNNKGNLDADFSDLISKMTINDAAVDASNVKFYCPNWIGASGGVIMRIVTNPAVGSVLHMPAGAVFDIGTPDSNFYDYRIAKDVYLQFNGSLWTVYTPVDGPAEKATFVGPWGTVAFNSTTQVLLQYSSTSAWDATNKGNVASKITYKNSVTGATRSATDADIVGWDGQKWLRLLNLTGYDVIEIAEGGRFGGNIEIPALTLYNVNGCWVTGAPHAATTNYTAMADGWNNLVANNVSNNILAYDVKPLGAAADNTNLAATLNRTSLMVKYNGKTFFELYKDTANANCTKYNISYAHGNQYFYFAIPEADLVEGAIFEVEDGTPFMNEYLAGVKLIYNGSTWETYVEQLTPTVVCQGIANDENNNIPEAAGNGNAVPMYRVLLKYDIALGSAANTTNVVSTTGEGILLNGVKLSEIPNASIDYAHGSKYIQIKIPQSYQDALQGTLTLEVVEGTTFESQVLDSAKFVLRNGKWIVYTAPNNVSYTGITWNDIDYAFGKKVGVLLSFSANLSAVASESNGGLQGTNFASTLGEHIYLGGVKLSTLSGAFVVYHSQNLLFIYADNMAAYRTLTIEGGTTFLDSILPEVSLTYAAETKWGTAAQTFTPVEFSQIQWNGIGYGVYEGRNGVLLTFSGNLSTIANEVNAGIQTVNFVKTSIGEYIKIGGTALKDIAGAEISYHSQGHMWVYAPNMNTLGNLTIESANFLDVTLPDLELTFNGSAWEVYVEQLTPTVVCQGIANDVNNNILETVAQGNPEPRYRTLLAYDIALGTAANKTNVVSTTGEGILLNGVKLSEIPNASIDYAHGSKYIQIKIPQAYQDAIQGDIFLEVVEGTTFENQILDSATFILKNGKWVRYVAPTEVAFTGIQWNDMDYDFFGGKAGVLLSFSADLSVDAAESNGGLQGTNFASSIGEHIYLGGFKLSTLPGAFVVYHSKNFLFIYADNMSTYRTLTIEDGTLFLNSILPEVNLYYVVNKWQTTPRASYTDVAFDSIAWNNIGYGAFEGKGGVLLNFSSNLSEVPNEVNASVQTLNLVKMPIGEKIKINGTPMCNIAGAEIHYHSLVHLWIYAPNMTFADGQLPMIEIEAGAQVLDVNLPEMALYFYDGAWTSVAPEILTINYATWDISYKQYIESTITVDTDYLTNILSEQYANVIVLGWTIGGVDYFYGDSMVVSTTVTVTITEVLDFYTLYGASIRIANDGVTGLRFGSRVGLDAYNALFANYSDVELGTYIAPKALLDAYLISNDGTTFRDYFAQEQGSGTDSKYVKVVNSGIYNRETYESDGYVAFYGSLANIHEANYYTKFVGVGYVKFVKEGITYVIFGATNLADTTRTVYDIAVEAYNDTTEDYSTDALTGIRAYIDAVVDLTYKGGNINVNEVVTDRAYTSPFQTSYGDGYYYVAGFGLESAPQTVLINGKKVSVDSFNVTLEDGSFVMSISEADLAALFTDGVVYGVGEPNSALWNNGNKIATSEMLSGIAGAMNAQAFRVWLSDNVGISSANEVSLNPEKSAELFDFVNGLATNGVKEIYIIGQLLPSKTYANYYVDGIGWVTSTEFYTQHSSRQSYMDYHCVPDPEKESAEYAEWLKIQYDYYSLLAAQIAAWQSANVAWQDVRFYFEGVNEPEGQLVIHKRGSYDFSTNTNNYGYFTSNELARILTDVAYYMTLAVNANMNQSGYVTTPALMYLTQDSGHVPASGVSTDGFLTSMATVIMDEVAPTAIAGITPANSTDPEDYFTVLNWHPYLAWTKTEHNSLYYAEIKSTWYGTQKAQVNSNYAADWVDWNNDLYHRFVDNFAGYAPKVVFTEIGVIDYGTHVSSYGYYKTIGVTEDLAAEVFGSLMAAVGDLDFSDNCTVIAFRLCDLEGLYKSEQEAQGYLDIYVQGEGNLGLIEEDGTIKAIMKEYYYVINGTRDTTALQEEVNKYYD